MKNKVKKILKRMWRRFKFDLTHFPNHIWFYDPKNGE